MALAAPLSPPDRPAQKYYCKANSIANSRDPALAMDVKSIPAPRSFRAIGHESSK